MWIVELNKKVSAQYLLEHMMIKNMPKGLSILIVFGLEVIGR